MMQFSLVGGDWNHLMVYRWLIDGLYINHLMVYRFLWRDIPMKHRDYLVGGDWNILFYFPTYWE